MHDNDFQAKVNSMTSVKKPAPVNIDRLKKLTDKEVSELDLNTLTKKEIRAFHFYLVMETTRPIPLTITKAAR